MLHLVGTYGDTLEIPDVGGELPTSWWSKEDDKSAILGAFYHGYSQYEFMRFDPRLSFLKHFPKAAAKRSEEEAAASEKASANAVGVIGPVAATSEATAAAAAVTPPAAAAANVSTDIEMAEAPADASASSVSAVKGAVSASLPEEDVAMGEAPAQTAPAEASAMPAEGTGAVMRDSEEDTEKASEEEEKNEEEEWPASKVLTRRLRKVLRALGIAYQGMERKKKPGDGPSLDMTLNQQNAVLTIANNVWRYDVAPKEGGDAKRRKRA